MTTSSIVDRVAAFLATLDPPLRPSDPLVAGVSGGPDSLALLHILTRHGLHPADQVVAAHLDHGWRAGGDDEAAFVAASARSWGARFYSERRDTVALARATGLSLEEAARQARYGFLADTAVRFAATTIATAHHAGDQAETVLMHFLRGSGLAGLRGMLPIGPMPVGPAPAGPSLRLIRPLLAVSRAEVEAYCQAAGLAPLADPSNEDRTFFRNRLRLELLPLLAEYSPQIGDKLVQLAAIAAADEALLQQLADEAGQAIDRGAGRGWQRLSRSGWRALPLSLRLRTLRDVVQRLRPALRDIGFRTIEQARQVAESGPVGAQASLPGGVTLAVGYETLTLAVGETAVPLPVSLPQLPDETAQPLPVPGEVRLAGGWRLAAMPAHGLSPDQIAANPDPWRAFVAVTDPLVVRPRRPGERFQPLGLDGRSAAVSDVMINRKIPAAARRRWPIVAAGDRLVWLVGHHLDERARVTTDEPPVVALRCWPADND